MNDKYGVSLNDLYKTEVSRQTTESSLASMKRGSVNSPNVIRGVDTDEEISFDDDTDAAQYTDEAATSASAIQPTALQTDAIFSLLTRFQMIRHVSQCYDYIINMRAVWGDEGISTRRSMLVQRLSAAQRAEFSETFKLIDRNGDGTITLLELKRVMESIGEGKSDSELREMIDQSGADSKINGESVLNMSDFMGIMAEAEFFSLFKDIFASLDKQDSGFVRASELDRVLCGVRDLISDDRNSIIDMEDKEMLIDYEQFTRMMLGSALL
jgi:calmodulin